MLAVANSASPISCGSNDSQSERGAVAYDSPRDNCSRTCIDQ